MLISKKVLECKELKHEGFLVYLGLIKITDNKVKVVYSNISLMEYSIKDNECSSRAFKDKIKTGLLNLNDVGIVNIKGNVDKNNYLTITLSDYDLKDSIEVDVDDIVSINNYFGKGFEPDKCLRYYLNVLNSINMDTKIGTDSMDVIANRTMINKTTAIRYNNLLEEMGLLYIYKNNHGNIYSRLDDKSSVIEYVKEVEENNKFNRNTQEYKSFIRKALEKDEFTCQCCGEYGVGLNVHHLNGYHWDIEGRMDLNNVVVLCEDCHKEFHKEYGKNNNTKEQYEEWINLKVKNVIFETVV